MHTVPNHFQDFFPMSSSDRVFPGSTGDPTLTPGVELGPRTLAMRGGGGGGGGGGEVTKKKLWAYQIREHYVC